MGKARKIAFGLGIASGAMLAAWLLMGPRKEKTRAFFEQKVRTLRHNLKKRKPLYDEDPEAHYV